MTTTTAAVESPASEHRTTLLCSLGDSWSAGVGDRVAGAPSDALRDQTGCGWPAHLAALLGVDLLNLGRNGARARDVLAHQVPAALAARPDLATLLVGGNDVLRGDYDPTEVRLALAGAVSQLLDGGMHVVLVTPPGIGAGQPAPAAVRRVLARRMSQVRSAVTEVGEELAHERLITVDADPVREHSGVFHIDRIHPSPLGHRVLAEYVGACLGGLGWPTPGHVEAPPPPPGMALQAAWLLVRGVPWVAKRSRDLLPELLRVIVEERLADQRGSSASTRLKQSTTAPATSLHRRVSACLRPASPSSRNRSGSASSPATASAQTGGSQPGSSTPVTPSMTDSSSPPVRAATTGTPLAAASRATRPYVSECDGTSTSHAVRISAASSARPCGPRNTTSSPTPTERARSARALG